MICHPSDHTVGRGEAPGPRFEPGTGDLKAGSLTTRPPPHLLIFYYHLVQDPVRAGGAGEAEPAAGDGVCGAAGQSLRAPSAQHERQVPVPRRTSRSDKNNRE